MPSSAGAERYIITCCLNDPDCILEVFSSLKPDDFYHSIYGYILQVCVNMLEENLVPEPMTIYNRLESMGVAEPRHLRELELLKRASYSKDNLHDYIKTVKELSVRRKIINRLSESIEKVRSDDDLTADDAIYLCEKEILDISNESLNIVDVHKIGEDSIKIISERLKNPTVVPGIPTGFPKLDEELQGLQDGRLYVLAARYKVGKSIWLMNVARYVAVELGIPVLMIDTENTSREIDDRFLSLESGVEHSKIINGMFQYDEGASDKIFEAASRLSGAEIYHHYMPNFTFESVVSITKKYYLQKKIGLVIFDYIKAPDNTSFNDVREYQMLGYLTSGLKNKIAGTLGIPVLTACQLNRGASGSSEPKDEDIADSDRIGRYADVVLYLRKKTNDEVNLYGTGPSRGNLILTIHTNRYGPAREHALDIYFNGPVMSMEEVRARKL